uniref:Uncharacterized protein n=1 Tax=Rhizophora mucronata TaxID=61149 RepID=A0A2P2PUQ0_RHIMU
MHVDTFGRLVNKKRSSNLIQFNHNPSSQRLPSPHWPTQSHCTQQCVYILQHDKVISCDGTENIHQNL